MYYFKRRSYQLDSSHDSTNFCEHQQVYERMQTRSHNYSQRRLFKPINKSNRLTNFLSVMNAGLYGRKRSWATLIKYQGTYTEDPRKPQNTSVSTVGLRAEICSRDLPIHSRSSTRSRCFVNTIFPRIS